MRREAAKQGGCGDKQGLARLSRDKRSAPPVEPVVQAHLDDIKPLGGGGLYRNNKTGRNVVGQAQKMRGVGTLAAKIKIIVLDEGGPMARKCISTPAPNVHPVRDSLELAEVMLACELFPPITLNGAVGFVLCWPNSHAKPPLA